MACARKRPVNNWKILLFSLSLSPWSSWCAMLILCLVFLLSNQHQFMLRSTNEVISTEDPALAFKQNKLNHLAGNILEGTQLTCWDRKVTQLCAGCWMPSVQMAVYNLWCSTLFLPAFFKVPGHTYSHHIKWINVPCIPHQVYHCAICTTVSCSLH